VISLAVGAAGWVGFRSPGDYAALQFPPTPRHDRKTPMQTFLDSAPLAREKQRIGEAA
jgi:hypothetical protein